MCGRTETQTRPLVAKPEGKKTLGKTRRRWDDNIETNLKEIGWESVEWIHVARDRGKCRALLNTVVNLQNPQNAREVCK
jgi:hypothetical protein